jgi:hypothetical protein
VGLLGVGLFFEEPMLSLVHWIDLHVSHGMQLHLVEVFCLVVFTFNFGVATKTWVNDRLKEHK